MEINTHHKASQSLLGTPSLIDENIAEVVLGTTPEMVVDEFGLIHGGFTFGLADYAAMLAVNHPNVVLGSSEVRFIAPVVIGDTLKASARVFEEEGRKKKVKVVVSVKNKEVFKGTMICYVLEQHILEQI